MKHFQIVSLNISGQKGVPKKPVDRIVMEEDFGVVGDAHAGAGRRQVSLLAFEDIAAINSKGARVAIGDFAENITTRGIDLASLPVGVRLQIGQTLLEITQIGKECHSGCDVKKRVGECIMPKRGVFAKVITGGEISNECTGTYGF